MTALSITGQLAADAELRFTPGPKPHAVLCLLLRSGQGHPIAANQDLGEQPGQQTYALARRLRRDTTVTVACLGIQQQIDHGIARMRLQQVSGVTVMESTNA